MISKLTQLKVLFILMCIAFFLLSVKLSSVQNQLKAKEQEVAKLQAELKTIKDDFASVVIRLREVELHNRGYYKQMGLVDPLENKEN